MSDYSLFTLLDPEFYVSLEQRVPTPEYRSLVSEALAPDGWQIIPRGVWTYVHPPEWSGPRQGWKLHVSATPANAAAVLEAVVRVLTQRTAAFKFASDPAMLRIMLSKNWPRAGGGKFVTVYPRDEEHFRELAGALVEATQGFDGPYILSDRRVPGSRVVFYRYGEHLPAGGVDAWGERVQQVAAPSGKTAPDRRTGYYQLPKWMDDPYGAQTVRVLKPDAGEVVLNGRYEVNGVLSYSNMGGVYRGRDVELDRGVVVRERRPYVGWVGPETDAVALLEKETRLLRAMDGTGWTPRYVDHFQVWEHRYLVMEKVKGVPLRDYALMQYYRRHSMASPRHLFFIFRRLILEMLRGIEAFHAHGIVLRDLSAGNVLVRRDQTLCFIDFEYAWERDGDQPFAPGIHTPGYATREQLAGEAPTESDDLHALGAVVVEMCSMLAPGLALNRSGSLAAAAQMIDEVGLPRDLLRVAEGLLREDTAARWTAEDVRATLSAVRVASLPWKALPPHLHLRAKMEPEARDALVRRVGEVTTELGEFFDAAADPGNPEQLWPASPEGFRTNTACIQFGACGPIEFVRRNRGSCPGAWLDWVERAAVPESCPPGLYVGLAGVALTLAACGRHEPARRLIGQAAESPLLDTSHGLYQGTAGVGLAALALGATWGDPELTALAVQLGAQLERRARQRPHGIVWRGRGSRYFPCGLGAGASGIALFFTYLGAATGDARHYATARQALEAEFAAVTWRGGIPLWPAVGGTRRIGLRSPHVFFGSAGVGTACIRLHACTGEPALLEWAEHCATALLVRWTNKPWQDMGYAGWGETLLDLHAATGNPLYREHSFRIAEALLNFAVKTRLGTAFPGGALNRVASDFGMGTAGIGIFLHRLLNPGERRAFFPDHLLPGWDAAAGAREASTDTGPAPETSTEAAAPRRAGRAPAPRRARTPA